ncbi:MAG: dephospho-CoA kinase [Candidatus Paceibacteria bacterium]|jgi:dephospho-CoA kinase
MSESPTNRPPVHPRVIGILGGIASGKSSVASLMAGEGGIVIDADAIARAVLEESATLLWLKENFDPGVLDQDGKPDREALGQQVFSNSAAREKLEGWILPKVRERIRAGLDGARAQGRNPIVLDVPLLLEHDADHRLTGECDFLVFIKTEAEDRDRRAQQRRGWPAGEVARRERVQFPLEEKRTRARHVIDNSSGLEALQKQVNELLEAEQLPH